MKPFLFSLLLLMIAASLFAQGDTVVVYYDRKGEPTAGDDAVKFGLQIKQGDHYKKLMVDARDNKVQVIAFFTDAECKYYDGPYKEIYKNGNTQTSGYYYQNKKNGLWKTWTDSGKLTDSVVYKEGYIRGLALRWNADGKVTDSLIFEESGKGVSHGYWSDGTPSQRGGYIDGKKQGPWIYYYKSGNKCQEVNYTADSATAYTCYDEQGNVQEKDCIYEQEANFPGGEKAWLKYLVGKLTVARLPADYYQGKIWGQVWIQFVVEIDGSLSGIKVTDSIDPRLDAAATDIIKRSPRWNHAVQFNRPVKAYRLQPITFSRATE
ncbi:MAG: energy transducer TonB [Bacteroidota bacterium]